MKTPIAKGVDVSHHNAINWTKVKKTEIDFVIIRAGYGLSTTDSSFKNNIENAIKVGLDIGIYYFSYAGTVDEAIKEANNCLKIIAPYRKYINYPVFFDWEDDSKDYIIKHGKTPTKQLASDMAIAFMDTIAKAGYKTGNYSNPNFLKNYFDDRVKKYDTWLAHVGVSGATKASTNYDGEYTIWQYSWVGQLSGFNGKVDMDYCYKNYSGAATTPTLATTPVQSSKWRTPADIKFYTDTSKNVITTFSMKAHANTKLSDHFQVKEFASKSGTKLYSDKVKIHNKLIELLEALYKELNCSKIIVNSGYRTEEHDKAVGGSGVGQHILGRAADIVCYDQKGNIIDARKVCCTLEDMGGVYGIGYISPRAVHVDTRLKDKKWWGDETRPGAPNITRLGYSSFHKYFNM